METSVARPYRMRARAVSVESTAARILDATAELFWEGPTTRISLERVAARAGVTEQTVIRRFGGRNGLFSAAAAREIDRVARARDAAAVATPAEAVRQLSDHYEAMGDGVLRMLAEATRDPGLRGVIEQGQRLHRAWCADVFADRLARAKDADRPRRLAQLVAVTDVHTWRLLRREAGLSRDETEQALLELVMPLLEGGS